jgi:hypothetical protein
MLILALRPIEMQGTHGCIHGANSKKKAKSFPTIQVRKLVRFYNRCKKAKSFPNFTVQNIEAVLLYVEQVKRLFFFCPNGKKAKSFTTLQVRKLVFSNKT